MPFLIWGIYNWFENGLLRFLFNKYTFTEGTTALIIGLSFIFCIAVSYLLGSVNFALVVSKLFYHDDVRNHGSGNAGATNMGRSYGKKAAILTFLGDGLKGVVAILIACAIFGHSTSDLYYLHLVNAAYLSAFFCIFGHVFPCFSHFRGGKGFATMALCVIVLNPFIALILLCLYIPLVAMTRYISLGSVVIALFYPIILSSFTKATAQLGIVQFGVPTLVALMIAALVTWAHRGNLKRIMDRTERKLKLWHKTPEAPVAEASPEITPKETNQPASNVEMSTKKHPVSKKKLKRLKKRK